ncbi:MAG: metalloregulator ArsR/SmtB family transcription factor [Lachnospiraceae bacterium]|nr:metalloregulator ArsR/SmtB family transcription factor [Lachnospiraceae bacterium]
MSQFQTREPLPICDEQHEHQDIIAMKQSLPDEDTFIEAADLFSLLSDSTRLRILWLLCHNEACVCDIASAIDMSSPAVSHHLRSLKQLGIITYRRQGKEVHYTLADSAEGTMIHKMIDTIFDGEESL